MSSALFRTLLAAVLLSMEGTASAGRECPWSLGEHDVEIIGNHVLADGMEYRAKGLGRHRLERDMVACGVGAGGQDQLDTWRRKRRNAWVTGTIGAVFLWPVWIVTGVQIHGAVKNKKALEQTLEHPRRPRRLDDA